MSQSSLDGDSPSKPSQNNPFLTQISESRQAFDLFKKQAKKAGLITSDKSKLHAQTDYYDRYISKR